MFTGLVEAVGTLAAVHQSEPAAPRRLTVASALPWRDIVAGESIAVDGCCLTVVAASAAGVAFEAATETLQRTTLQDLTVGSRVNLERALRLGDRLGGHLVTGHIDGRGAIAQRQKRDSALYVGIDAPPEVARLCVPRGSITVAGVSLTVTKVEEHRLWVALIPHTLSVTTLQELDIGTPVNLEADMLARYVERLLQAREEPHVAD